MLAEQDAAEQETQIQQIAAKIPGGTESVADFRREQRLREERLQERPGDRPTSIPLSAEETERLFVAGLEQDKRAARGGVSEFQRQRLEAQLTAAGLDEDERASRGGVSELQRQKLEEQLVDAGLEAEAAASAPQTNRFDLLGLLPEMFRVTTTAPFKTSPETWRAFAGDGANGRTPEMRFREIADSLGYSSSQIDALLAGAGVQAVGLPRPTVSGVRGALTVLQVREPQQSEPSGLVIRALDATPVGNTIRTARGVGGALLDGDPLRAADELGVGLIEGARDSNPLLLATDLLFRRDRERPASALEAALEFPLDVLEDAGRPGGATVGALSPSSDDGPLDLSLSGILRRAGEGFADPRSTSGREVLGVRDLSDEDVLGPFSERDFGGFLAELGADPLNLVPGGGFVDEGLDVLGRGLRSIARRATRAADDARTPRFETNLDSPANRELLGLIEEGSPVDRVDRIAFLQEIAPGRPPAGHFFASESNLAAIRGQTDVLETGPTMVRRWNETKADLAQADPIGFIANESLLARLDGAVDESIQRIDGRASHLRARLDDAMIDDRRLWAGVPRLPAGADPQELERAALVLIRESLTIPTPPGGFADLSERAVVEAQHAALARLLLDFIVDVATHDWVVARYRDAVEKGGFDALERLLLDLE
jgi:hypothetical protein